MVSRGLRPIPGDMASGGRAQPFEVLLPVAISLCSTWFSFLLPGSRPPCHFPPSAFSLRTDAEREEEAPPTGSFQAPEPRGRGRVV